MSGSDLQLPLNQLILSIQGLTVEVQREGRDLQALIRLVESRPEFELVDFDTDSRVSGPGPSSPAPAASLLSVQTTPAAPGATGRSSVRGSPSGPAASVSSVPASVAPSSAISETERRAIAPSSAVAWTAFIVVPVAAIRTLWLRRSTWWCVTARGSITGLHCSLGPLGKSVTW